MTSKISHLAGLPRGKLNNFMFTRVTITALLVWMPLLTAQTFSGVKSATISLINGVPQLKLDGKPVPPLIFFYNNEAGTPTPNSAEISGASANAIHIYSAIIHWNWLSIDPNAPIDWTGPDSELQRFVDQDPQALFLVRLRSEPPSNWYGFNSLPSGVVVKSVDGSLDTSLNRLSWGWQAYHDASVANISNFVRHYESSAFGKRIIAYHPAGGVSGEWFGYGGRDYRQFGPDYSDANLAAFRAWLKNKYGSDAQIKQAWGRDITLTTAAIPTDALRFPAHNRLPILAFYSRPAQQDWIDFASFESDYVTQWILDIAQAIKLATNRQKLAAFFYGYTWESFAPSLAGHSRLDRLLASSDVDIICAPISYQQSNGNDYPDRWYGGPAGFMSAVDSVAAHGKLWINENDILSFHVPDSSFEFANRILQRDLAAILVHRAGTWWMDLFDTAPFADPRLWSTMGTYGYVNYQNLYVSPKPYLPDVCLVSDAVSNLYVADDTIIPKNSLMLLKNYAMKAGVSTGFYTFDDFAAGIGPQCAAYVFANTTYVSDAQAIAVNQRLDREGALAIWQYAPGFLGPQSAGADRSSLLTGISLAQVDGYTGTNGTGPLTGKQWGFRFGSTLSPRLVVKDPSAISLGTYYVDGLVSTAIKRVGSHNSLFVGDFILSSDFIRVATNQAGAHVWVADDSIVHTDGNLLVVHSGVSGTKRINLPTGVTAKLLSGQLAGQDTTSVSSTFSVGETQWFQLNGPPALAPAFTAAGVANTASYLAGVVAPGELVTIFGSDLGPDDLSGISLDWTGRVSYHSGGTTVTFDGIAAPVVYAVRSQVSVIVPYSVAGKSITEITVFAGRTRSSAVIVPVVPAAPGVFVISGGTQAAALNADSSVNSASNPVAKGSVVVLYATGEGQTTPAGTDGLLANSLYPKPKQPVAVTIGGANAPIAYSGAAPSLVAGVMQVNIVVPQDAPSGNVPVVLSVGGITANPVTIAVQ